MPAELARVLLSDATSYKAAVLAAFLKRHYPRLSVFTCDPRPASRLLHTRWSDAHHVLACGPELPERYAEALAGLARELRADLVLPFHSREMEALIPRKAVFGAALGYWGELDAFQALHSKDRLYALARGAGVAVPRRFETPQAVRAPAVAKPLALSSAHGVRYLANEAEVRRFCAEPGGWDALLVQEYVAGAGVGYSAFARDGQLLAGYGHRRLAEFPVSGGSSVYREGDADPRLREAAERLLSATRWSGFVMFEFKRTAGGELLLLEANPRIWGSIHQPLAAGVNLLEPLFGPARLEPAPRVRTYFSPVVYLALSRYALGGRPGPLVDFLAHLGSNRADVALHRDPFAWFASLLRVR